MRLAPEVHFLDVPLGLGWSGELLAADAARKVRLEVMGDEVTSQATLHREGTAGGGGSVLTRRTCGSEGGQEVGQISGTWEK